MAHENVDRYALAARVHALLAPELAGDGWDLVDVRIFRGGGRLQVRLYVDLPGDVRIDLDGCARASRAASMFLEEADLFPEAWVLEVSSPGIRRPLRTLAHFAAAVGQPVELKWRAPAGGTRPLRLRGTLRSAQGGELVVERTAGPEDAEAEIAGPVTVPLEAVLEANLDLEFDAQAVIREDRRRRKEGKRDRRAARRGGRKKRRRGGDNDSAEATGTKERDGN